MEPIYITGAGVASAIGIGKEDTLTALLTGRSGIRPIRYLLSSHTELPVGEVQLSNEEMVALLGLENGKSYSRSALIGKLALKEALIDARLYGEPLDEVHFISGTTVGGMDQRELIHAQEPGCSPEIAKIVTHNCATCTEMIAEGLGSFASMATVSTACSTATNAIITGANMLRSGLADIVVVGGTECLSLFHLNGFNALMILDHQPCRPFDRDRAGLNLGEGAAFLVMEKAASARQRGLKPKFVLSGYANTCDAFHQTASSPEGEGAFLAMTTALKSAGLKPSDIHYINAHGTGTPNNDESEGKAIRRVFGEHYPPVSSTKSFTGHTTSASGSIEAVFCLLALEHQFIPLNLNWKTPMEQGIQPVTEQVQHPRIEHILTNAFGFGGNDSSLIISKVKE